MTKILFVCHGNICRSPMAEFVFKDLIKKEGIENQFEVESAATSTEEIGNDIYPPVKQILREKNISFSRRGARQITSNDYYDFDYLIGMDTANIRNMNIKWQDTENKIHMLLEYTGQNRSVSDPWYTDDFETCYRDVLAGCKALLSFIQSQ